MNPKRSSRPVSCYTSLLQLPDAQASATSNEGDKEEDEGDEEEEEDE